MGYHGLITSSDSRVHSIYIIVESIIYRVFNFSFFYLEHKHYHQSV